MDDSDVKLLERSLTEPRCFEELVVIHSARLHAYLARRAPAVADDLLSEVWLAAFEGRHRYDRSRGGVVGWLFGIARHTLLAHQRHEYRRRNVAARLPDGGAEDGWAAIDARLDAEAVAGDLRRALAGLPAEEREVLLLVAWEHLSPTEVAQTLDIPAGTARSRLHRARTRIRTAWSERSPSPVPATADHPTDRGAAS